MLGGSEGLLFKLQTYYLIVCHIGALVPLFIRYDLGNNAEDMISKFVDDK